jgi:hypothetical protein
VPAGARSERDGREREREADGDADSGFEVPPDVLEVPSFLRDD